MLVRRLLCGCTPGKPLLAATRPWKFKIMASTSAGPYTLSPLPVFGVEAHGIDLKEPISDPVIEQIKEDVTRHRIVVFRDQGIISGDRHVEISQWFGPCESTFYKHPASPHPDVFRVSNDRREGCTGVGRTGWHVDGSFQRAPFAYSLYHIVAAPSAGATLFAPLHDIIALLPPEQRARWERLSMASDRRGGSVKPLIYSHPVSGLDTLCLHLGMTAAFVWDHGTPQARVASPTETEALLTEIERVFKQTARHLVYAHHWQHGDFMISDNAAVAHEATEDTQAPRGQVGLRVLHRTTVQGTAPPEKKYKLDASGRRVQMGVT